MSDTEAATSRIRRPLMIAIGVLGVAALAYFLVLAPNQDDGVEDVDQTQAVVGSEPAAVGSEGAVGPDADSTEESSEEAPAEPSFEVFNARDPFDQLVLESTDPVGDTQDTAATTPTGDSASGTAPAEDADSSDTTPAGGEPAQTTVGVTTIRLDEVFSDDGVDKVIVEVNSDGYEAAEDETVAGNLTVLDIAGSCATMRFDDTRFILCEGEQIQK